MMSPAGRRCSIGSEYVRADNAIRMGYCCMCRAGGRGDAVECEGLKTHASSAGVGGARLATQRSGRGG